MRHLLASFLFFIGILIQTAPSHAAEVMVAMDHYPPWKTVNNGQFGGIDAKLITALLSEVGLTPKFVALPWSRGLEMLKNGDMDMLTGVLRCPDREEYLHFVDPPYKTRSSKALYVRKGSLDIRRYNDLKRTRIGVQRGATYFKEFDTDSTLNKQVVTEDIFNFRKLAQGRIDVVIATESQGDYLISSLGLNSVLKKCSYRHDKVMPVHFVISKQSPLMSRRGEIDKAARRLRDNGTFDRIIKDYFKALASKGLAAK